MCALKHHRVKQLPDLAVLVCGSNRQKMPRYSYSGLVSFFLRWVGSLQARLPARRCIFKDTSPTDPVFGTALLSIQISPGRSGLAIEVSDTTFEIRFIAIPIA